jgi:hypothetical protein
VDVYNIYIASLYIKGQKIDLGELFNF